MRSPRELPGTVAASRRGALHSTHLAERPPPGDAGARGTSRKLGGTMAAKTPAVGIEFTETMKGFVQRGAPPELGYVDAERAGQRAGTRVEFTLTISIPSLDDFLADRAHTGSARGTVHIDGFTGAGSAEVTSGVFNLFVDTDSFYERKMLYAMPFYGSDGKPYL